GCPPQRILASWPGLSRPSTSLTLCRKDVDARDKRGHDETTLFRSKLNGSMFGFGGMHPKCLRHPDQIGRRSRSHLLHEVAAMHFHGDLTEPDLACDLFAHQPARDQSHDFPLARGK